MDKYEICKKAHEERHKMREAMMNNGDDMVLSHEGKVHYLFLRALCEDGMKEDTWKDYHEGVYGATYPEHDATFFAGQNKKAYTHKSHKCTIDSEMKRIIDHGEVKHMEMLSDLLSTHFHELQLTYPAMYDKVLLAMKNIK